MKKVLPAVVVPETVTLPFAFTVKRTPLTSALAASIFSRFFPLRVSFSPVRGLSGRRLA